METIVGNFYNPYDNSHCININTKEEAYLVPWVGDNYHNPTRIEAGANFVIVSEPYDESVRCIGGGYETKRFVNVKSSITDDIYRTLYWEDRIIFLDVQKIENLISEYNKVVPSLEYEILMYLLKRVNKFEGKYIDMTYIEPYAREMVVNDEIACYTSISVEKSKAPSQKEKDILVISFIDKYNNQFEQNGSQLSTDQLIDLFCRVNEHIDKNGYNNIVEEE